MTLGYLVAGGVLVPAAFLIVVILLNRRKLRQSGSALPLPATEVEVDPREERLDGTIQSVRHILLSLAGSIRTVDTAADSSYQALESVRETIDGLKPAPGLEESHQTLLIEVERMITSNALLRKELRQAREAVNQQRKQIESLRTSVRIDALTQLANRAHLDEHLQQTIEYCKRYGESFSLLMVDIDHFKDVNDTHGHQAGDRILRGMALKLKTSLRDTDFVARYGGEEFAVIMPRTSLQTAFDVADKVREAVEASKFKLDDINLKITISGGVTESHESDTTGMIVDRADSALYEAKEAGRNQIRVAGD